MLSQLIEKQDAEDRKQIGLYGFRQPLGLFNSQDTESPS